MSLNLRIILSASLVLVIFITLIAGVLDRAFVDSTESSLRDKLTSQLYALMAAAEVDDSQVLMPSNELDALLGLPSSGVYAYITDASNNILWQSTSVVNAQPPQPVALKSGEKRFIKTSETSADYYSLAYGVSWSTGLNSVALTFNIVTDLESFNKQINQYRTTLWSWLVAMAAILLISQAAILGWGLSPLRKVGVEINRIEMGDQEQIENKYPKEIDRLTGNINRLIQQERDQKTRYRNALGDLAHSLKTPLTVLQTGLSEGNALDGSLREQIRRMDSIIEYQLQRAATAGSAGIGSSVKVRPVVDRIVESLCKVYADKHINLQVYVDADLLCKVDEGDLMELLGNLLDNAFKWASENIEVHAELNRNNFVLRIVDDGPGIPAEQVATLLQRGVRADQSTAGHGIGLSIVGNIVDAYQGKLHIDRSSLGGCEVRTQLPA